MTKTRMGRQENSSNLRPETGCLLPFSWPHLLILGLSIYLGSFGDYVRADIKTSVSPSVKWKETEAPLCLFLRDPVSGAPG